LKNKVRLLDAVKHFMRRQIRILPLSIRIPLAHSIIKKRPLGWRARGGVYVLREVCAK